MIKNGSVFNFNNEMIRMINKKVRIIIHDQLEIFYEPWVDYTNEWYDAKARTISFGRMSLKFFLENSSFLYEAELTDKEKEKYHPDLPMRLNRFKGISWSDKKIESMNEFKKFLNKNKIDENSLEGLNTSSVFLEPLGPKGGQVKPVLVQASDNKFISGTELIFNAFNIQADYIREPSQGIGLFRLGCKNKIPSYYIGHYHDLAGITKAYESQPQYH